MGEKWTAEAIYRAYEHRSLRIGVPVTIAYLTFRLGLITEDRKWNPHEGLIVQRGRSDKDVEKFSVQNLAESFHPDVDYIKIVDIVRSIQLAWNFIARPLNHNLGIPIPILKLWDRWGTITYRAPTGNEFLRLELVDRPAELIHLLQSLSQVVWTERKLQREAEEVIAKNQRIREIQRSRKNRS